MQYGYFDDQAKEYVITRPDTPQSWSNYLGSTEYGAIITNNAGGYGFYQSARRGRFLRLRFNNLPVDQPGRYFYLRDRDSGDYWSASWQPVGKPIPFLNRITMVSPPQPPISSPWTSVLSTGAWKSPIIPAASAIYPFLLSVSLPTSGIPTRTRSTYSTPSSSLKENKPVTASCGSRFRTT
jgi:N,N'-diacetylchitobiose phosphorylase